MFRRVLVGVDGGTGGKDAVRLAEQLVDVDGRLTLGHVHGRVFSMLPSVTMWSNGQVAGSEEILAAERAAAGGSARVDVASVGAGSPGEGLHRLAERLGADLIVVGTSHHHGRERLWLGDEARSALNGAPCAVAIAPTGFRDQRSPFARIGVGYDGSPESALALVAARGIAVRSGADIEVLEVAETPISVAPAPWDEILDAIRRGAEHRVAVLEGVHGVVKQGSAGRALVELSAEVDLLLLGSRSYGPLRRLMFGSTSLFVQRRARCPLVVLRRVAAAPPAAARR